MLRFLLFIFLCLLHGGLLEQDPTKCTQNDAGTNQVMYYLLSTYDPGSQQLAYCSSFDDNLQGPACNINRGIMYSTTSVGGDLLMNMDFAVLKEASGPNSEYDMQHLGYPITYMNLGDNDKKNIATFIEFHVFKSNVVPENNDLLNIHVCGFHHRGCRLRDDQEFCADHNMCLLMPSDPLDLVYLDIALYVNEYHARNAYFFVKKGNKVGLYSIEFPVLLEGQTMYGNSPFPKFKYTDVNNMELIRNFPQHNYQEHFFAFDAHFGCFALLYWEGSRSHTPEVHYYLFDENHPSADVKLVEKIVLHGFDFYDIFDRSKGYYANILTFPVFKSFGRQVFIGVQKTPGADRQRYRIWTPNRAETRSSDDCNTKTYPDNLHIVHARRTFLVDGRWIRTEKAQPIQPTTKATTTTTKQTTLPPTTKPTTVPPTTIAPSTAPPTTVRPTHAPTTTVAPSTAPPTTLAPTTTTSTSTTSTTTQKLTTSTFFSTTTTTVPGTTSSKATTSSAPDTPPKTTKKPAGGIEPDEDYNGDGADGKGSNAKDSNTNGQVAEASSGTISLWGLLPVVFLDVILVIVLIVLIVLMFIGKKKMRAAAAKRMSKTSVKKSGRRRAKTPKSDSESGKVIMGNEKPSKKAAMKSKKDKAGDSKKKKNESKKSSKKDGKKKGAGGGAPKKNASVKGKKNKK